MEIVRMTPMSNEDKEIIWDATRESCFIFARLFPEEGPEVALQLLKAYKKLYPEKFPEKSEPEGEA